MEILAILPPEVAQVVVAVVGLVTALRALAVVLERVAIWTVSKRDDEVMHWVVDVLSWLERALDWASVGPTARKRG